MRALGLILFLAACASSDSSRDSYAGIEVSAELTPASENTETVRATVTEVSIVSSNGRPLATATAFEPQGSADEVLAVNVLDTRAGFSLIAVTTTLGGHREWATFVTLYRFDGYTLEKLYTLEQRKDQEI